MASVNDVLTTTQATSYYDPQENVNVPIIPNEKYRAFIIECKSQEVTVRKKYKAKVFNYKLEVAEENSDLTYTSSDGKTVNGGVFSGKTFKGAGIFHFLTPSDGDDFEANPGGNERYMEFCEAIGIEYPEVEIEVEGKKRMVKTLPELETNDLLGKPILATLVESSFVNKENKKVTYFQARSVELWETEARDLQDEDLPF